MDPSRKKTPCKNSTFGCTFASSSVVDMVDHFQCDCAFHPVRCFKCYKAVRKTNFTKHFAQCCRDGSSPPCPAPEDPSDVGEAMATMAMSQELHFLRECVRECTLGVESLRHLMKNVAGDVAQVKVMKEKQQDLEAIVKGQGDVIQELSKGITFVVGKVNKVQEDVSGLVNRLEKDAETVVRRVEKVDGSVFRLEKDVGTMVERVENVDGSLKECAKDSKAGVERLSRVMRDREEAMKETQQGVQAIMKQQGDLIKELGRNILTNAEMINKLEQGVGSIVQRVEKVDGLVKDVSAIKRGIADQSRVHWYVENVSQYIEKAKTERSCVKSEVFVVRGYSVKLLFQVKKQETELCIGLFLCLCRGPNDSLLQWPFRIPYTLSLIHPKDASKTKEHKVTPPSRFADHFEKPNSEENKGVGIHNFCTVEEAQKEGFIENNAVCFAVTLHE